ncbi:hypothetical protein K388_04445 [Streptomyces sp. KhCrAH-43]|uniref:hypothetical protein n=1 Tax=unclassified Streptomyces TaxID=2593676 RepID=UPI000375EF16|nr:MULTISPECIES: hypothetical protein [unclassified Streptomyces]MYS37376.1 hypothetical protein [Streptomyces sp. SID4920]MYX68061.1 hypothetical protein [Streptomyces sp. SID8373]RAJ56768.1 hypothetical protein K388_04445 [Streptomyces sp. KhCrAH-43]
MNKDTDRTPQPPAAPVSPPATDDRTTGTGSPSPHFSDDTRTSSPRTAPSTPPATAPVPLAEKETAHTDTGHTDTGRTGASSTDTGHTDTGRTGASSTGASSTDTGRTRTGLGAPDTAPRHTDTDAGATDADSDNDTRTFRTATARHEPDRDSRTHSAHDGAEPLLPTGDQDKLAHRLHQAVTDFVESPQRAVEEAESTFDAVVAGLTDALKKRRSTLHVDDHDGGDPGSRTEELRITLQHYRDLTERLLKI